MASERDLVIEEGFKFLRDGKFSQAVKSFETLIDNDPTSPEGYFFISLSHFIHMIYNPENKLYLQEFENNLKKSISKGKTKLKTGKGSIETELFLGTSHLLESYYKALQKEYFGSAFSARRGKKLLERSLKKNPELYDAYFGLGIFNYYADRVPSIVKGLRFLLFLPGGNHAKGLSQLTLSSSKAKYLNVESSLMLAEIYASKHERDYYSAYKELSKLQNNGQHSLLIQHAIARLEMKILNFRKASMLLEKALANALKEKADRDVIRMLRMHLAQCYYRSHRFDRSLALLEDLCDQPEGMSHSMTKNIYILAMNLFGIVKDKEQWEDWKKHHNKISSPFADSIVDVDLSEERRCNYQTFMKATQFVEQGDFQEAFLLLEETPPPCRIDEHWNLFVGEMRLKAGQPKEALDILMEILHSGDASEDIKAVAELRAGNCFDAMGKRSLALSYYERLSMRATPAREAAYFYLKSPFEPLSYFPQEPKIP